MVQVKVVRKHCKIRSKKVNLVKEALSAPGKKKGLSWCLKKCLDEDKTCEQRECIYAPKGIGEAGTINPFSLDKGAF